MLPPHWRGRVGTHPSGWRGRVRPGPAGRGARRASWSPSGFGSLLRLRCSPRLQRHLYPLAAGRGAGGPQGTLPGPFGVIRPRSIGQTPKDVVVGTRAAWAGPWAWRRRVGGNLRLPASGCPRPSLRGPLRPSGPVSLGDPTSQLNRPGGVGGPREEGAQRSKIDRSRAGCSSRRLIATVSVGRSQTPGRECP